MRQLKLEHPYKERATNYASWLAVALAKVHFVALIHTTEFLYQHFNSLTVEIKHKTDMLRKAKQAPTATETATAV